MRRREQYARGKAREESRFRQNRRRGGRKWSGKEADERFSGENNIGPGGAATSGPDETSSSRSKRAFPRLIGRLSVQRSGVGFVRPDSGRGGDIFVHASNFGAAWHGDQVEVTLLPRRGRSREGVITAVLSRGREIITAEVMRVYGRKGYLCRPLDPRMGFSLLAKPQEGAARPLLDLPAPGARPLDPDDLAMRPQDVVSPAGRAQREQRFPQATPERPAGSGAEGYAINAGAARALNAVKASIFTKSPLDPDGDSENDSHNGAEQAPSPFPILGFRRGEGPGEGNLKGVTPFRFPSPGDVVLLKPGDPIESGLWAAEILDNFGPGDNLAAQEGIVKAGHGIPTFFPDDALAEAEALRESGYTELNNLDELLASGERKDLRHIPFVTIDGEAARDFDDAVYVEERENGFILWVGIADVSHYVRSASALDGEALARGNSYYFPQSVEPMLPEALSNDLCSLLPDTPRLAMVARMPFDEEGRPSSGAEFYPAVIQSRARLTYTQVFNEVICQEVATRPLLGFPSPDIPLMLKSAEKLARLMHGLRLEAGGLDFELPDPEVRIAADGESLSIAREEHNFAHQLIEMFMVAANEAVATFLTRRGVALPYRVHPPPDPDKLAGLFEVLARTGLIPVDKFAGGAGRGRRSGFGANLGPGALGVILDAAQGTDAEFVVSRLMLRSMMQARYSLDNEGHFGLASACYCHFTSPIRRYADLLTHRALKAALRLPGFGPLPEREILEDMLETTNSNERVSKEAEREILKRMTVFLLKGREGEVFDGVISGVTEFGLFVELTEIMAEGMIRLEALGGDYYEYFPERQELLGRGGRRRYYLGMALKVRLMEANLRRLEINLEPVAGGQGSTRRGRR